MINSRLQQLRAKLIEHDYAAYIMPLGDPHQSEYPASYWKSLPWISGFSGSAGIVVVTLEHAGLWTDSRYFIQAEQELSTSSFEMHKMDGSRSPSFLKYLGDNLSKGDKVIADGPMISLAQREKYNSVLSAKGLKLTMTKDFISHIWEDRPEIPQERVFEHDIKYAGIDRKEKIANIRTEMEKIGADQHLITTLDDIAWLLNLRGSDVACNPVFCSYCLIRPNDVILFVDPNKLSKELKSKLSADGINVASYESVDNTLAGLDPNTKILLHKGTINVHLNSLIPESSIIYGQLISRHLKAVKNDIEIGHFRDVHVKDAVALTHAFYWLEKTLAERTVSEVELGEKIAACRAAQDHYYGESFNAIVGYKGNGAIIHYRAQKETCADIENNGILLVDSGGQYHDGTTDITRTITMSAPPPEQKDAYTRVLKGHIGLAISTFPIGTTGGQLDTFARQSLWKNGLNYGHGTGHGVGFFLNVHEPPQGFAPGSAGRASSIIKEGMVTSNEPGHYVTDKYGIRIENLILTVPSKHEGFLTFETITYFPIDTQLIEFTLLTKEEVDWLNDYHQMVWEKVGPHLEGEHKAWMKKKCVRV